MLTLDLVFHHSSKYASTRRREILRDLLTTRVQQRSEMCTHFGTRTGASTIPLKPHNIAPLPQPPPETPPPHYPPDTAPHEPPQAPAG